MILIIGAPSLDAFTRDIFASKLANCRRIERGGGTCRRIELGEESESEIRNTICHHVGELDGDGHILDVVAESENGVVTIGNLPFNGSTMWEPDQVNLLRNKLAAIRLLGCVTAASESGRKAMLALRNSLMLEIFGTTRGISRDDFNEDGFIETPAASTSNQLGLGLLISADDVANVDERVMRSFQAKWLARFRPVTFDVNDLERVRLPVDNVVNTNLLAASRGRNAAVIGAIGARPELTFDHAAGDGNAIRIEVLCARTLLRMRSKTHGVVYVPIDQKLSDEIAKVEARRASAH